MRPPQLEAWVLSIVEQVAAKHQLPEDSRVELKADWPEANKAGRRIAALANASGTNEVLWIVGLDEKRGVVEVSSNDFGRWWPQVEAEFEGIAPSVSQLQVPTEFGPVVALLFDSSQVPFVVKNAAGGTVQFEVPWRHATGTRTARRSDLLQILVPAASLPALDVIAAEVRVGASDHQAAQLTLRAYVIPRTSDPATFLLRRCSGEVRLGSQTGTVTMVSMRNAASALPEYDALVIAEPTAAILDVYFAVGAIPRTAPPMDGSVHLKLVVANGRAPVALDVELEGRPADHSWWVWRLKGP